MESLYRKYRPQTFADVVGQQHVVGTLEHAVLEGRTSHAYLFCGPRGTGKTTMARLLAKALMCEQGAGHLPDGTCEQCQLIAAGEHPDVYELDAASRTGVDNVREEIINRVSYAPVRGRYKVYIIDEVHMLTTAAFNALLKTLEEPPGHVVFVLCTTDPQKIPATILSRVQRFDFRPIGNEGIRAHLLSVCEQEGFTYEDAAIDLVVRHARGGMRDALSTLEQLSVFGGGVITLDAAQDLLGAAPGAALDQVVAAMASRDVAALFTQVGALVDAGRDLLQFTRELAARMRDVYVVAVVGPNPAVLPIGCDIDSLATEAQAFGSADRLSRVLALLGDVSREMATAPNQRLVLEVAFTRVARPQSDLTIEALAERVAELERQVAAGVPASSATVPSVSRPTPKPVSARVTEPQAKSDAGVPPQSTSAANAVSRVTAMPTNVSDAKPATAPKPQAAPITMPAPQSQPASTPQQRTAAAPKSAPQPAPVPPQPVTVPVADAVEVSQPLRQPTPTSAPTTTAVSDPGTLQRMWRQVMGELIARLPSRGSLLASAMATSDDGERLVVSLPKGSTFALKMLERPDIHTAVEAVVLEVFGPRKLACVEGGGSNLQIPAYAVARQQGARTGGTRNDDAAAQPEGTWRQSAPAQPAARPASQTATTSQSQSVQTTPQSVAPKPQPGVMASPAVQQPSAPDYPMPWDAPQQEQTAAPQPSPADEYSDYAYDQVPYDEIGAFDYVPQDQDDEFSRQAMTAAPQVTAPSPMPAPTVDEPPGVVAAPSPTAVPQERPLQAATTSPGDAVTSSEDAYDSEALYDIPSDLPADLSLVLENAFEVFGTDVTVRKES